jgi:hypothetical protein
LLLTLVVEAYAVTAAVEQISASEQPNHRMFRAEDFAFFAIR